MARGHVWTLGKAHDAGQLVRVRCRHCVLTRFYQPSDLRTLVGDVGIDRLEGVMRCERCGLTDWIEARFETLSALERQGATIRRLVEVRMIRKIIWRDE